MNELLKEALDALNITSDTLRNAMTGRAVPKATTLNALEASRIAIASLTAALLAQEQEKGVVFQRSGVIPLNQHHSITWRAPLASVEAQSRLSEAQAMAHRLSEFAAQVESEKSGSIYVRLTVAEARKAAQLLAAHAEGSANHG